MSEKNIEKAYKIFKKRITLVPIINKEFKLTDVITIDDIFSYLESKEA